MHFWGASSCSAIWNSFICSLVSKVVLVICWFPWQKKVPLQSSSTEECEAALHINKTNDGFQDTSILLHLWEVIWISVSYMLLRMSSKKYTNSIIVKLNTGDKTETTSNYLYTMAEIMFWERKVSQSANLGNWFSTYKWGMYKQLYSVIRIYVSSKFSFLKITQAPVLDAFIYGTFL